MDTKLSVSDVAESYGSLVSKFSQSLLIHVNPVNDDELEVKQTLS